MLFKILHGDSSRISVDITPFHEGYCYVTHDGFMYIDINTGTNEAPNNQRIKLNAKDAQTLTGASLATILNSSDIEIPTSKAVFDALSTKVSFTEEQSLTDEQKQQAQDNIGIEIATDDEIVELLMQEDMLPVVTDSDGSLLADESDNILLW